MKSDEVRRAVYVRANELINGDAVLFQELQAKGATETQIRKAVSKFSTSMEKKAEYRPHAKSVPEPLA